MPVLIILLCIVCLIITVLDLSLDRCFSKRLFFYCGGRDYDYRMDMLLNQCMPSGIRVIFKDSDSMNPSDITFNLVGGGTISFQVCTSIKDFSELGIISNMEKYPSWYSPNMRPSFKEAEQLYNYMQLVIRKHYSKNLLD